MSTSTSQSPQIEGLDVLKNRLPTTKWAHYLVFVVPKLNGTGLLHEGDMQAFIYKAALKSSLDECAVNASSGTASSTCKWDISTFQT